MKTKYYNTMYDYAKDAGISHYRMSPGMHKEPVLVSAFLPCDDPKLMLGDVIVHAGETYREIGWGEPEPSAILLSAVGDHCYARYIRGEHEYVSDGIVYQSNEAARAGK